MKMDKWQGMGEEGWRQHNIQLFIIANLFLIEFQNQRLNYYSVSLSTSQSPRAAVAIERRCSFARQTANVISIGTRG